MTDRMLQGMKALLTGVTLGAMLCATLCATLCAAQDVKPGAGLGSAGILQAPARPELLSVKEEAAGAISRADLDGMEKTLAGYQNAFESMSLPGIYSVWPGLDQRREAALSEGFKFLRTTTSAPRLDLQCTAPAAAAVTVALDCREALTYTEKDNKKPTTVGPVRVSIKLKKESDIWVVETMKGL